jgi:hypothetical protein
MRRHRLLSGRLCLEGKKIATSFQELDRQYRLIKQTVAIHYILRDRYHSWAVHTEIVILAASVIFLLTTFADENLYNFLGIGNDLSKLILGLASAVTFFLSLILIVLDWPGKAASHKDSAERWFSVLVSFRDARLGDGTWPLGMANSLSAEYANVCKNSVGIPDKKFNALKVQYLTKVEISKLSDKYPGAPSFLLWILVKYSAITKAISGKVGDAWPE